MRKVWTEEDIEYLRGNYEKVSCLELATYFGVSERSVYLKAFKLGIKGRPTSSWNVGVIRKLDKESIDFIVKNSSLYTRIEIIEKFNINKCFLNKLRKIYNLEFKNGYVRGVYGEPSEKQKEAWKKQSILMQKYNEQHKVLSDEDIITVRELYEDGFSDSEIAVKCNCSTGPISKALKGIPKRKPGEYLQHFSKRQGFGETHHTWQGGIKSVYDRVRDLKAYWTWRHAVVERDNSRCTKCGNSNCLEVHHKVTLKTLINNYCDENNKLIKELTEHDLNSEYFYSTDNGITYCENCHREYHREYGRD